MSRSPHRLVIGMLNTAGQAREWANAVRHNTPAAAESWGIKRPEESAISFTADRTYTLVNGAANQAWKDLLQVPTKPTHLIIESGKPIVIRGTFRRMLFQALTARRHGIGPALLFHGSDIRVPSMHAATHPGSPFHESLDGLTAKLEAKTQTMRRWLRVWRRPEALRAAWTLAPDRSGRFLVYANVGNLHGSTTSTRAASTIPTRTLSKRPGGSDRSGAARRGSD